MLDFREFRCRKAAVRELTHPATTCHWRRAASRQAEGRRGHPGAAGDREYPDTRGLESSTAALITHAGAGTEDLRYFLGHQRFAASKQVYPGKKR